MIQWLKEHVAVISFGIAVITSIISFIIWLDSIQDTKLTHDIINPMTKDIHDEIIINRQETLQNRQETITNREMYKKTQDQVDKNIGYIRELEKQSVRMEQKIDDMMKMMQKEFNNKSK